MEEGKRVPEENSRKGLGRGASESGADLSRGVENALKHLHEYRVRFRGLEHLGVFEFIDRDEEARAILEGAARLGTSSVAHDVIVLYGPKGCGKTELFKAILESVRKIDRGGESLLEVIYVGRERSRAEKMVRAVGSGSLLRSIAEELRSTGKIDVLEGSAVSRALGIIDLGWAIAKAYIGSRTARENGRILIVMDEIRVKKEEIEDFAIWLNDFENTVGEANDEYFKRRGGVVTVVILTSDALAARAWDIVGDKVGWAILWNLSREAADALANRLGIDEDRDLLWRLAGGNSREIGEIRRKGLVTWLNKHAGKVAKMVGELIKQGSDLLGAIKEITEDPDRLSVWSMLAEEMLERNIVIEITDLSDMIKQPSREEWIGKNYAFQLPVYYYTLRVIASKRGLEVLPRDVMEEAGKS